MWRPTYPAKMGRANEGGPNTRAACESADVRHPFLGLCLGCGSGLRRKLEHCCFLTFNQVSQEHDLPVWKLQRIMMRSRLILVDLPEDGRRVIDCFQFQPKNPLGRYLTSLAKASSVPGRTQTAVLASPGAANPRVPVLKLWVVSLSPTLAGRDFTLCKL